MELQENKKPEPHSVLKWIKFDFSDYLLVLAIVYSVLTSILLMQNYFAAWWAFVALVMLVTGNIEKNIRLDAMHLLNELVEKLKQVEKKEKINLKD